MAPPPTPKPRIPDSEYRVVETRVISIDQDGDSPDLCQTIPLTPMDYIWVPFPVVTVFPFPTTLSVKRMKRATQQLITTFPILAGRITQLGSEDAASVSKFPLGVVCNNAGALFQHLKCMRPFSAFGDQELTSDPYSLASPIQEAPYIGATDVESLINGEVPLLRIYVVHFVDKGSLLGVSIAHGVVDGFNYARTANALLAIYRGDSHHLAGPELVFDRASSLQRVLSLPESLTSEDSQGLESSRSLDSMPSIPCCESERAESRRGLKRRKSDSFRKALAVPKWLKRRKFFGGAKGAKDDVEYASCGIGRTPKSVLHPWWDEASENLKVVRRALAQWKRFAVRTARVSKHALRIPPDDLQRLRSAARQGSTRNVSTTDSISGLLWLLATSVRKLQTFVPEENRFMNVSVRLNDRPFLPTTILAPGYYGNATSWLSIRPLWPRERLTKYVPPTSLSVDQKLAKLDDVGLNSALGWAANSVRRGRMEFQNHAETVVPRMVSCLANVGHFNSASYLQHMGNLFHSCDVHVVHVGRMSLGEGLSCGESTPEACLYGGRNLPPWSAFVTRTEDGGADVVMACSKGEWRRIREHIIMKRVLVNCQCV